MICKQRRDGCLSLVDIVLSTSGGLNLPGSLLAELQNGVEDLIELHTPPEEVCEAFCSLGGKPI